jgi:hypothetical protein
MKRLYISVKKHKAYSFCIALCLAVACKKPYLPPVVDAPNSYLVVEGVLNASAAVNDTTFIKLSHTVKLADKTGTNPETGAQITVEGDGFLRQLIETNGGNYYITGLGLNTANKYQVKITTSSGLVYESDPVEVKITPEIDDIGFRIKDNQLQVLSNAHDASNNTRYYRYEYDETWRFHSRYESSYKVENGDVVRRGQNEGIYNCFAHEKSNIIALASTSKLAQDVVSDNVVANIGLESEKISVRYSMLLKQYALTKEAYEFWENLKKNTEQLGSVFDALPSQLTGNIHSVNNPAEPVIGYIGASTVQTKRVYINKSQLPDDLRAKYPYECSLVDALYKGLQGIDEVAGGILNGIYLPVSAITDNRGKIIGFTRSEPACVDCTLRGVRNPPAFWTDN